jgi:3-hydroxypropionate dehydrogenase (NADP+)
MRRMSMDIRKTACIGAGLIGTGFATVFSSKGLEVIMQDVKKDLLEAALEQVKKNLIFLESHGLLERGGADGALKRIRTTTRVDEAVDHAEYVQESVPDNYAVKKQVFKEMDAHVPQHTILASSSSGLLMTEIQKAATRPERCVLVHPMLPVHLIPVVEVAGGEQTARETVQATQEFMNSVGKMPVVLNREVKGYIVNRLQAALLREAMDLVDKGIASAEDVDKAFRMAIGLRDPLIGPFMRIHLAGNGIERFIENYAQSYHYRWETMETWTSIPPSAAKAAIEGLYKMEVIRAKTLEEIKAWRDTMLVKILKLLQEG